MGKLTKLVFAGYLVCDEPRKEGKGGELYYLSDKEAPEGTVLNRRTKDLLRILDPVELGVPRGSGSLPSRLGSSALLRSIAKPTFSGIGSIPVSKNRM